MFNYAGTMVLFYIILTSSQINSYTILGNWHCLRMENPSKQKFTVICISSL